MKGRESGMPDQAQWESFFNPRCVLRKLGCDGSVGDIVEFGCGYGTFTIPAAELVRGRIFALDIESSMVGATARRARQAGYAQVLAEERDFVAQGCGRPERSVDYALLFNILHIEDPVGLLREAGRVLAPHGKAGIIHWSNQSQTPRGPSLSIRPTPEQCRRWGEEAGFEFVRHEALDCCPWHWGLVMRKAGTPRQDSRNA